MTALMADVNAEGQDRALIAILEGPTWRELWLPLGVVMVTLAEHGLDRTVPDDQLWRTCQGEGIVLITANRNATGPDSLEAAIRTRNTPASLPVITLARPKRSSVDRANAERAAGRLIEILIDLDDFRGSGRLYIP